MPKIIFVPKWLQDSLVEQNESVQCLGTKDIKSVILSGTDVINYIKAQAAFAKLLSYSSTVNNVPSSVTNIYEQAYGEMFHGPDVTDEDPVFTVHVRAVLRDPLISVEALGKSVNTMGFEVEASECGQILFVKVKETPEPELSVFSVSQKLLSDIMCCAHNLVRVNNGAVDKSSVLRENPTLALFYVKCLLAS